MPSSLQQASRALALTAATLFATGAASAAPACNTGNFASWLESYKQNAAAQGIARAAIEKALAGVTLDPTVIRKDRGQGVFQQTFLQFSGRMVNSRMSSGPAQMRKHAAALARAEKQFGVPGAVIVALWGLETDFGADNGTFPVIRSVATLAYDCRRPEMFREELAYAIRIVERGDLSPAEMVGAWAGEIGQTQFSLSAYYKYALDYDGDGRADLIRSAPDVIASTANLLAKNGWRRGEPWLQEVRLPASMPWEQADLSVKHPRAQWAQWGVTQPNGSALPADSMPASLVLPMGRLGPAFLAYENFNAFLEWNQALVYATTAAYYAARLAGAPAVSRGAGTPPVLSPAQIIELQRTLAQRGYDLGKADGKLGLSTRAAVRKVQLKAGLPADGWPTPELLAALRRGA